jgi:hypothetical protein
MRSYRFQERLGSGGFGDVYRAELLGDGGFRKPVAIKLLHDAVADREVHLQRLRDEARLLGLLRHQALVGVDGLAQLSGPGTPSRWAMLLELVDGPPTDALVRQLGPLPEAVVLHIGQAIAGALATAHTTVVDGAPLALVHRDVKPANVHLAPDGRVKLLDFGIAVATFAGREAQTRAGGVLGTPHYMAPERLIGDDGPESDVFSVGLTLATLATGRHPAPAQLGREPHEVRITALFERLSPTLRDALSPLVAFVPAERPTAREVERRLALALSSADTDPRDWATANVPGVPGEPGPLTGVVLTEGLPPPVEKPASAGRDAAARPRPVAAPRTDPRPAAPEPERRTPRRRWAPIVLALGVIAIAVVTGGLLFLGGGTLMLGAVTAYPQIYAEGCAATLTEQITRLQGATGPGVSRGVAAAEAYENACHEGNGGFFGVAIFVSDVDDALEDGTVTLDEAAVLEETYDIFGTPLLDE